MGGDSNISPPHLYQSESSRFSLLGFRNVPLLWCPQVLFGGGGCLFTAGFPHPNLLSIPCPPQPEAPSPIPGSLASSDTQHGTPLPQTHRQPLVFLLPDSGCLRIPHPPLLQSRQQPVASYLSGVTPYCHLLTAAAPAPPRQTQHPSWSSAVTLGL